MTALLAFLRRLDDRMTIGQAYGGTAVIVIALHYLLGW